MNTKGVEDGMSDEQMNQFCECGHERHWHSLSSTHWIVASLGCLAPGGQCGCKQFVTLRSATPEEEEDADCEGCNRVDCKGCAYNDAHPPPDFVTKAGTRVYIPPAAVPVEERTADGKGPHACMHSWGHCASARRPHVCCQIKSHDADHSCTYCEARPIPEERTAEMDELMELLRKSAIAAGGAKWTHDHQMYVTDENGLMVADVRGFGRGMDENFAKHITAASPENILRLLDHIEGTAKCKKAIDKTFELACEKWPNITVCEDCFDEKRSDEMLRNMWICAMHIED